MIEGRDYTENLFYFVQREYSYEEKLKEFDNALLNQETEILKNLILDRTIDLRTIDGEGNTYLHRCVTLNKVESLACLLEIIRANPFLNSLIDHRNYKHKSPIMLACETDKATAVELLIDAGADLDQAYTSNKTLPYMAASCGAVNVLKVLRLRYRGVNLEYFDICAENLLSPLFVACKEGHAKAVRLLLDYGLSMLSSLGAGQSAFHVAAWHGKSEVIAEMVQWLKERGMDYKSFCNRKNLQGYTPLYMSFARHQFLAASALLGAGAEIGEVNGPYNKTIFHLIVTKKWQPGLHLISVYCTNYSIDCAPFLEVKDSKGRTPFFLACMKGDFFTAKNLHILGAKIDTYDNTNTSALHAASRTYNSQLILWLMQLMNIN